MIKTLSVFVGVLVFTVAALCGLGVLVTSCTQNPDPKPPSPVPTETGGAAGVGGASSMGGAVATGGKAAAGGGISTGGTTALSTDALACQKLHALGCPEAADPAQCANLSDPTSMAARCRNPKVKCNPACIIAAVTKADVQTKCHIACGAL